jgi:hypothetical protein
LTPDALTFKVFSTSQVISERRWVGWSAARASSGLQHRAVDACRNATREGEEPAATMGLKNNFGVGGYYRKSSAAELSSDDLLRYIFDETPLR